MDPYEGFYYGRRTNDQLYEQIESLQETLDEIQINQEHIDNLISTYPSVKEAYENFKTACQLADNDKIDDETLKDHYGYEQDRP